MVTLGRCLRKVCSERCLSQGLHCGPLTLHTAACAALSSSPLKAQAAVEGPPLDVDKHSNPLMKPPRGNKREALQGCIS